MVIIARKSRQQGMLMVDVAVALAIFVAVLLPLSLSFLSEQKILRSYYYRALATGIVDGEMEVLAAGEWRGLAEGKQTYNVQSSAATNLPPGKFMFSRDGKQLRLEWHSEGRIKVEPVIREALGK